MEQLLANILTIMTNTSLTEQFYKAVLNRLVSFGYEPKEEDGWVICFAMQKIENHIKNTCNTPTIPDGLFNVAVDMVCGEFLFDKKQTGKLELTDLDLNGAITQIHEGDVTVHFASGMSDEERFNSLINYLLHGGDGELICYRRMVW